LRVDDSPARLAPQSACPPPTAIHTSIFFKKLAIIPHTRMLVSGKTQICLRMNPPKTHSKCVDASYAGTDDESVDVMRTLVGFHRFEVHHVSHDRIVVCDAVRSKNIARHARALESHPDIVPFGHRDMLGFGLVLIFQPSHLQCE